MADAADTAEAPVMACGFCMRKDEALVYPKTLPCLHVHCLKCLTDYYDRYSMLECPLCRKIYDVTPDSLPAANIREDNSPQCDVCVRKGVSNARAAFYCTMCSNKFCHRHQEAHNDLLEEHPVITIDYFKIRENKLEVRPCTDHEDEVYSMGCTVCMGVFCVQCLSGDRVNTCTDGNAHQQLTLDEFVMDLAKEIDQMKGKLADKEDKLAGLSKLISKVISDHDVATEDMVITLHGTRDAQLEAIGLKYKKLEAELIDRRKASKSGFQTFMEENVDIKLAGLRKQRLKSDAQFRHNHQVDIVRGHNDMNNELQMLIDDEIPALELDNMTELNSVGESRNIELEMTENYRGNVNWEQGLTTSRPLPKTVTLLNTVPVAEACSAVCHYKGTTYVGMDNGKIDRIDVNYQLTSSFINIGGPVEGIAAFKDEIYSLMNGNPYVVNVHDLSGKHLRRWNHTDSATRYNNFAIVADQIVIPDRQNQRLALYSPTGELQKSLSCQLSDSIISICAAGEDSVVVTDYTTSKVFRLNINTGSMLWTMSGIPKPEGVAKYGLKYLVVAAYNNAKIWFLDAKSGDHVHEVPGDSMAGDHVLDLDMISGSVKTLIVPKSSSKQVLFYQLSN